MKEQENGHRNENAYSGTGLKNIIGGLVFGKVSARLGPDQDIDVATDPLTVFLTKTFSEFNSPKKFTIDTQGAKSLLVNPSSPL